MANLSEIKDGAILFDEKIGWIGNASQAAELISNGTLNPEKVISAKGKTILPGFCDSHTHIVFAGNRSEEFGSRLRGATYQEIAAEGGGILRTMNATRNASIDDLRAQGRKLAISAMKHGTTAIEIKSGYGLNHPAELNQLRAIKLLQEELPLHISSTFLGAHDFPPEYKDNRDKYVDLLCNEMIPALATEKLADYCDAFVDLGYYTVVQAERIFETAYKYGMKIKVHADELACVNASEMAARVSAVSADHLLFISDEGIAGLQASKTVATLLPGTAYFIRMPYAPARKIIDSGVITALATDCNPGSCFTENMQMILSLAVINMKMTAEESITAATLNGAAAIEQSAKMGSLEVGKQANFIIADIDSYTDLFYHFGVNHISDIWINGRNIQV
jgi:imidazolonepropionase